jgi:hypothetical protein
MHPRFLTVPLPILFPAIVTLAEDAPKKAAHANIVNAQGAKIGSAKITSTANGVKIAVTVSARWLIDVETHRAVFSWVRGLLADRGLIQGKRVGVDATTLA